MKWKKLKDWWKKKVKKFKKDNIKSPVTGSKAVEIEELNPSNDETTQKLVEVLMDKLMDTKLFEDELPQGDKKRFFLFSPALNMYRDVGSPVEATVIEESNGRQTLCIINNVPYLVPDEYLKNVGYN